MTLFDDLPEANPEEAAKEAVLSELADSNAAVLDWLRQRLKIIYRIRCYDVGVRQAYVSADDARVILDADPRFNGKCRSFLGALFKAPGWKPTGEYHKSTTPGSHANRLVAWKYEGADCDE